MLRDASLKEMVLEGVLKTIRENGQILGFLGPLTVKNIFHFFSLSIEIKSEKQEGIYHCLKGQESARVLL